MWEDQFLGLLLLQLLWVTPGKVGMGGSLTFRPSRGGQQGSLHGFKDPEVLSSVLESSNAFLEQVLPLPKPLFGLSLGREETKRNPSPSSILFLL